MRTTALAALAAATLLPLLPPAAAPATAQDKPAIETAADLPRTQFELAAEPSVLVLEAGDGFEALKDAVRADAQAILSDYDLRDAATEKQLRSSLRLVALLDGRWRDVLEQTDAIVALEEKPAARETAGLLSDTWARAAMDAGSDRGGAFEEAFRQGLRERVAAIDYEVAQDHLQSTKASFELLSEALLQGSLEGAMDPNAQAQGMKVGREFAAGIVSARQSLEFLPLKEIVVEVLQARIDAATEEKADRWSERLVSLEGREGLAPVIVGVWDSGTDPSVFEGRMWTNPDERPNGEDDDGNGFVDDLHGVAFGMDWERDTGALRTMPQEDVAEMDDLMRFIKGALDLQASLDTEEARAFRQKMAGLTPEEVMPFQLQLGRLSLYLHGTATAYTSVRDNPAAKILYARFNYRVQAVPDPIDEEAAEAFAGHVRDTIAYLKANGVKVVNMSWRITTPQIEGSLASVESDTEKRRERAEAIFATMSGALEEGFRSAPEILFVPGAGNEDEDVEFVKSFPAGINLPNVLTVGAVDVSLQPASFTSYGESIDLYANGFEVPSKVPGGGDIRISGTSLAAPQVTNLAAKLWALEPGLSVADVRQILLETATAEGERGLPVIDPQAAVARVAE